MPRLAICSISGVWGCAYLEAHRSVVGVLDLQDLANLVLGKRPCNGDVLLEVLFIAIANG